MRVLLLVLGLVLGLVVGCAEERPTDGKPGGYYGTDAGPDASPALDGGPLGAPCDFPRLAEYGCRDDLPEDQNCIFLAAPDCASRTCLIYRGAVPRCTVSCEDAGCPDRMACVDAPPLGRYCVD